MISNFGQDDQLSSFTSTSSYDQTHFYAIKAAEATNIFVPFLEISANKANASKERIDSDIRMHTCSHYSRSRVSIDNTHNSR